MEDRDGKEGKNLAFGVLGGFELNRADIYWQSGFWRLDNERLRRGQYKILEVDLRFK